MKIIRFCLVIMSLALCLFFKMTDPALAHGSHFHSLEELAEHIENHIGELEQVLSQKPLEPGLISLTHRQIIEHGKQYQEFIQRLTRKKVQSESGRVLETMSARLIQAGHSGDLFGSLGILRQIRALLEAKS